MEPKVRLLPPRPAVAAAEDYFVAPEKLLEGNPRQTAWVEYQDATGQFSAGLWASRAYLQRKGTPRTPAELETHRFVVFPRFSAQPLRLSEGQHRIEVEPASRLAVDDPSTLRNFLLQGEGIGMLPDFVGRGTPLVRVLPKWTWSSGALSFVYPGQRFVPANVRAFIDTAITIVQRAA